MVLRAQASRIKGQAFHPKTKKKKIFSSREEQAQTSMQHFFPQECCEKEVFLETIRWYSGTGECSGTSV